MRIEDLYEEHGPKVYAVCRSLLRDSVEAEDAAQQAFLSAHRALRNGSTPADPAAWLVTIARNECIARSRSRSRRPVPIEGEPPGATPDAHTVAVRREQVAELRDALADLPAMQREAILLREVRGFSYDEVAETLSLSSSAVESLLFRARRGLQLRLRDAVAALSPAAWLGPLREAAARLAGGGFAGTVAGKAIAIGAGSAVVAGGAAVTPELLGLGHPSAVRHPAAPSHGPPPSQRAAVAAQPGSSPRFFRIAAPLPAAHAREDGTRHEDATSPPEGRDAAEAAPGGRARSDGRETDARSAASAEPATTEPATTEHIATEHTATEHTATAPEQQSTQSTPTGSGDSVDAHEGGDGGGG